MRGNLIHKIETYDAGKMSNQQLADDWRIAIMFWANIKSGRKFKYTREQVINVAKKIKHEIDRRVADGKMVHEFNPPSDAGKELLKLLAYTPVFPGSVSRRSSEITLEEVLGRLNDFKVRTPLAWIVGSLANWERTDGDVDILINANADEPLFHVMNFRILRAFPPHMRDRIHCLPNDNRMGPFTSYVPIYELAAVQGKRERIEMSFSSKDQPGFDAAGEASLKENKIELFRPFYQQKPTHGRSVDEIYSVDSVLRTIQILKWKEGDAIAIENKRDGVTAQAHKKGLDVKIWTEQGTLLNLPQIEKELSAHQDDFIVIGELELFINNIHQPRADAAGILNSDADKSNIRLTLYDKLYMNGDIHDEPFSERRKKLELLKESERVKINPIIWNQHSGNWQDELKKEILKVAHTPGAEGAMLKLASGKYDLDRKTTNQIKFKKEREIIAEVKFAHVTKNPAGNTFYYDMKVDGSPYVGRTYNTLIKAEPGDKLKVVFVDISEYHDGKTVWWNWWAARPIQKMDKNEKTASVEELHKMVVETTGRIQDKKMPKEFTAPLPEGVKTLSEINYKNSHKGISFEDESLLIRENKKLPGANVKHKFVAAQWTHKNGHPRCLICGDEPRIPISGETPDSHGYGMCDEIQNEILSNLEGLYIAVDPKTFVEADAYVLTKPNEALKSGTRKPVYAAPEVFDAMKDTPFEDINLIEEGKIFDVKGEMFIFQDGKIHAMMELAKKYRYVLQIHMRGRSAHGDFRFEKDDHLEGFTLAIAVKDELKKPVLTLADAKAEMTDSSNWKMDFASLASKQREGGIEKISCSPKADQPKVWLDMEGVTDKQEPGEPIPVGATKRFPGVFLIVRKGLYEPGADKPDFKEFFTQEGRIVFRYIPGLKGMKWEYWKPEDQNPYVLSDRAVSIGWLPPIGQSALPSKWENKIPSDMKYWEHGEGAQKTRDLLVAFFKQKKELSQESFVFARRSWKGEKVIRDMPVTSFYLKFGKYKFSLGAGNPLFEAAVNAEQIQENKFFEPGSYAPGTIVNPENKKIPATIQIVDSGDITIIEESELFLHVQFHGKYLKGRWVFKRGGPNETLWDLEKSRSPQVAKAMGLSDLNFIAENSSRMSRRELSEKIGFAEKNIFYAQKNMNLV